MLAESLPAAPDVLPVALRSWRERSPTNRPYERFHDFGTMLEPRYIVGTGPLDQ